MSKGICADKKYIYKTAAAWCLVIIWAAVIFYLSSRTADQSTVQSRGMIQSFSGILGKTIGSEELMETVDGIVRETAHGIEYFILGALVFNAMNAAIPSVILCAVYALSDEIHQISVPGRAFQIMDLFIDFIGIVFGVVVVMIIFRCRNNKSTISSCTHQE